MVFVTYKFVRSASAMAFLSPNRASTDALGALARWASAAGRAYEVKVDEDDCLIAELAWNESDATAGDDLNSACERVKIERAFKSRR